MRIVVTGGSGKGGRGSCATCASRPRRAQRRRPPRRQRPRAVPARRPDRSRPDAGGAVGRRGRRPLRGDPRPGLRPEGETFRNNAMSTYNVFAAAVAHGMRRVVWASSETVLGLPFDTPPAVRPDRRDDRAASRVALRAVEARRRDDGDAVRAADRHRRSSGLRISNIMEPDDYAAFPSTGTTRGSASGTCGATSTRVTSRRPRDSASRPTSTARRSASSPRPTR